MPYTVTSDDHFDREERLPLSRSALLLEFEATVYCGRAQTDGRIPRAALRRITSSDDPEADAAELVVAGIWETTGTGWQCDWSHQRSREQRERDAAAARTRKERWQQKQRNGVRNAVPNGAQSNPIRSEGEDGMREALTPSAVAPAVAPIDTERDGRDEDYHDVVLEAVAPFAHHPVDAVKRALASAGHSIRVTHTQSAWEALQLWDTAAAGILDGLASDVIAAMAAERDAAGWDAFADALHEHTAEQWSTLSPPSDWCRARFHAWRQQRSAA